MQFNFRYAARLCWLAIFAAGFSLTTQAAELSRDVRKGSLGPDAGDGGYIEIGLGASVFTSPVLGLPKNNSEGEVHVEGFLDVSARYQYRSWFAEFFSQGLQEFTLGYNFYNSDHWAFDWVGLNEHFEISAADNSEYSGLKKRRADFLTGPRATIYLDNYIVQLHLLKDISNTHKGELYSLNLARYWQYRSWNIHAIVGASYRSADIVDYYFSIDQAEASAQFPAVTLGGGGMAYVTEAGLTYPLSEKWVWRGFVRRIDIESGATISPLILSNHGEIIAASLSYVF